MALKHYRVDTLLQDYAASAGDYVEGTYSYYAWGMGVYVKVNGATDIQLQVYTANGWVTYDTLSFSGAGENFWNIWNWPFTQYRFVTTNAVTLTIQVWLMG